MKSNASASTIKKIMTCSVACSIGRVSGVFDDDRFEHVAHVVAVVGHGFQRFVQALELDQLSDVRLLAEDLGERVTQDLVGVGFQRADFRSEEHTSELQSLMR